MKPTKQLAVLERLLDDPSPIVREALITEIKAAGDDGLLWLEDLTKKKDLATHAKSLLSHLRTSELAARHFIEHIKGGIQDLEEACLLFERVIHPTLADNAYEEELDHLAERTRELITEPLTVQDKCRLLCRVIFGEEGYRGAQESFSKPDSSLLSTVIKSHRGIPISLCLIYLLVAQRLSLPIQPVGLPGRFMVGIFKNNNPIFIDCYEGGTFRTRSEIQLMLLNNHLPADDAFLKPISAEQTIARCCRNLVSQFEANGDDKNSRLFLSFVNIIESRDPKTWKQE